MAPCPSLIWYILHTYTKKKPQTNIKNKNKNKKHPYKSWNQVSSCDVSFKVSDVIDHNFYRTNQAPTQSS